ncbi:MAG: hypothetical protein LQ344_002469 [Seirophora lacunosa]|nr:MAG: hypothetical protein LQ344_002469 [Seirophora lacunosa]
MCCSTDIFLALLAVLFPPIAVWIKSGLCTADSLINILLCTLGFIPGLLHAWYIIAKYPDPSASGYDDLEGGPHQPHAQQHVTYYYVNDSRNNSQGQLEVPTSLASPPQRQQYPGYGTVQGMRVPSRGQQGQGPQAQSGAVAPAPAPAGEGSSQGQVPPSYEQAIKGDNKVQT